MGHRAHTYIYICFIAYIPQSFRFWNSLPTGEGRGGALWAYIRSM